MIKFLFPGTFDPLTLGHLEIIQRAIPLCDRLYVALTDNQIKHPSRFSIEDREKLLKEALKTFDKVEVVVFSGLVVDCAENLQVKALVRGLRNGLDFDYEYQMACANRQMTGIETIFLAASPEYVHLSSTLIREIAGQGRRLHGFVPETIEEAVFQRLSSSS